MLTVVTLRCQVNIRVPTPVHRVRFVTRIQIYVRRFRFEGNQSRQHGGGREFRRFGYR